MDNNFKISTEENKALPDILKLSVQISMQYSINNSSITPYEFFEPDCYAIRRSLDRNLKAHLLNHQALPGDSLDG